MRASLAFRILQWIVFRIGHTKSLSHFPWMTWDEKERMIEYNEIHQEAIPKLQPGDIILHRDKGFFSNMWIGGAMIHAGIVAENYQIIEAIKKGVVKRHVTHILRSDYACILRPIFDDRSIEAMAKMEALYWSEKIIDFPYDVLFDFCGEEERKLIKEHEKNAKDHGVRFCCTEIPYFAYLKYIPSLGVERRRNINFFTWVISFFGLHPGKAVIDADMYIKANFEIIWLSHTFTTEWAQKMKKKDEKFINKIKEYWA